MLDLQVPLVQHAVFDDCSFRMDIMWNVATTDENTNSFPQRLFRFLSLPNLIFEHHSNCDQLRPEQQSFNEVILL